MKRLKLLEKVNIHGIHVNKGETLLICESVKMCFSNKLKAKKVYLGLLTSNGMSQIVMENAEGNLVGYISESVDSLSEKVNGMITDNQYDSALELLENEGVVYSVNSVG